MALLFAITAACTPPPEAGVVDEPVATAVEHGQAIYEVVCWACHGLGGHGDGPAADSLDAYRPPTFHTQDYKSASPTRLEQLFRVAQARDLDHPHALYVSPFLTDEALRDAVRYVSTLAQPPHVPGSARAGAGLYRRLCAGCHGPEGRGGGDLRDFLIDQEAIDLVVEPELGDQPWLELFRILDAGEDRFHGSQSPAWGSVLADAEVWDLVAHIATLREGQP